MNECTEAIWVPVTRRFDPDLNEWAWAPEQPAESVWTVECGAGGMMDMRPDSPTRGQPIEPYWLVRTRPGDVAKFKTRLDAQDVPERARLMLQMVQRSVRRSRAAGLYVDETEAERFFDEIPDIATADETRKRVIKDVLIQAVARGLSVDAAERIRTRHNLPLTVEGGLDGR